jgi:hypothetical protein
LYHDRNKIKDHKISINRYCPGTQKQCPIRGNGLLCVQGHLDHQRHLPECIQNLLRPAVQSLAQQWELKIEDGRPKESFWKTYDKEDLLKRSVQRHNPKK